MTPTLRVLAWCLHLLVAGLLALVAGRAVLDGRPDAWAVAAAAAATGAVYAAGPLIPRVAASRRASAVWLAVLGAFWLVLLVLSAEAVWLAFPLYLVQLHLLSRRGGLAAVAATAVAAIAAFAAHQGGPAPAAALGPTLGAAVAVAVVWSYQALYRESEKRRRLIEELTETRADLARAQHTAGVLAERERLAREIHDTLAQGFSSIQLLLTAAGRALPDRPEAATAHVDRARQAAADNLAEARRLVAALTPPDLEGRSLPDALERLCDTASERHPVTARFHLEGTPVPLPTALEVELLRIAQSALGNTVRHAQAAHADVTLRFTGGAPDAEAEPGAELEVADDGTGFDAALPHAPDAESGGFGLAAMRARMRALGGSFTVDTAPARGTTVTARVPVAPPDDPTALEQGPGRREDGGAPAKRPT
ncbi:sensor histidine kinase [Nocardiopsis sp. RSe5-2]|uniref:Oxygen sensor histidine kinase NreB n=1 Tax=Nocardiopsis endophytica TaxID=3018445 RepID=A0ABT4UAA7_9ACTN|nr:sensor histidine kinase [Nocardiopsis endophytica]MDA2813896.1 sensor histidine kinase [Nocardiopsis endophytica]